MVLAAGYTSQANLIVCGPDDSCDSRSMIIEGILFVTGQYAHGGVAHQILMLGVEAAVDDPNSNVLEPLLIVPGCVGADCLGPPVCSAGGDLVAAILLHSIFQPRVSIQGVLFHKNRDLVPCVEYAVLLHGALCRSLYRG